MVKRGYHVMAVPKEGLENIRFSSVRSPNSEDSDVLKVGYLGLEIKHPHAQKQMREKSQVNNLTEQIIEYVPTQAFQHLITEYSQLGASSDSEISLEQGIQPLEFSSDHNSSVDYTTQESEHGKQISVQVLLPKRAVNPLHWFQLDDTGSDSSSLGSASIDTNWSESSKEELSESLLERYSYAGFLNSEERTTDSVCKEVTEAVETSFIDMDDAMVHYNCDRIRDTASRTIEDNRQRIMKVKTMTDLNNENHFTKRQNAESLNSLLSNVIENDLAGKVRSKHSNVISSGNFSNGMSEGNLSNLNKMGCTKRTNSDDTVLDMQKYVIQKENMFMFNKNNYNVKSWNVKCFDCKTMKTSSKLDSSASPESFTPYPLGDLYKKRQNAPIKSSTSNIMSLILCGCKRKTTKRTKKYRLENECSKKTGGRLIPLEFIVGK